MNYFEGINQSEVSRVAELLPEALRKDSHVLVGLLEEYYRYMSTVDLPSHILNSLEENYSIDEVSEEYLPKIKQYIAPYVPNSSILTTKQLYNKIVKYFYNARGSKESALVFFKIFFGKTDTEVFDFADKGSSGVVSNKWIPYTYGIKTDIPLTEWEIPYRALIHPAGFRFFAYLLFVLYSQNHYDLTAVSKEISESSIKIAEVEKYFCFKTSETNNRNEYSMLSPADNPLSNPNRISDYGYGSHSPTYQPGWFETSIRKLFFFFTNGSFPFTEYNSPGTYFNASLSYTGVSLSYEQISQIVFIIFNNLYENNNHHLQNLRDEYRAENKFRDPSVIGSFMSYTIVNAETPTWNPDNPAQFQNVGMYYSTRVEAFAEVSTFTFIGDPQYWSGQYFTIGVPGGQAYVWFGKDSSDEDNPAPAGFVRGIRIDPGDVSYGDPAPNRTLYANKIVTVFSTDSNLSATRSGDIVTITSRATGARTNITLGTVSGSDASVAVVTQGS